MPLTNENMQRVISQSQREPGMIAGLSVQAPDGPNAPTPANIAGASPSSSGAPPSAPAPIRTGIPPSAPLPAQGGQAASMPPQVQAQPTMPTPPIPPQQQPAQTAPPGQAPGPSQPPQADQGGGMVQSLLTSLGIPAGALAGRLARYGGAQPMGNVGPPPITPHGVDVPSTMIAGPQPPQAPQAQPPMPQRALPAPTPAPEPVTATSPIGNILRPGTSPTGLPIGPSSSTASMIPGLEPFNNPITGVRPTGIQPPPTAPVMPTHVPPRAPSTPTRIAPRIMIRE
jgi:hypothetical protein